MFRLSREVRFAIDPTDPDSQPVEGRNGYAGKPAITGIGQLYYALTATLEGEPDATSGYLINIKQIDSAVREIAIPIVKCAVAETCRGIRRGGGGLIKECHAALSHAFPGLTLARTELLLSPHTSLAIDPRHTGSTGMILLSHAFEFAASHRLHNPSLSDEENRRVFGKCNNPHGHGHNYTVKVTLRGEADENGFVINFYDLERLVDDAVIQPFDHKHLNIEVPEFVDLNPSVENIAKVIYQKLVTPLQQAGVALDGVTVWETPKTWCEYRQTL